MKAKLHPDTRSRNIYDDNYEIAYETFVFDGPYHFDYRCRLSRGDGSHFLRFKVELLCEKATETSVVSIFTAFHFELCVEVMGKTARIDFVII